MKIFDAHIHVGSDVTPDPGQMLRSMEKAGVVGGCILSIDPDTPGITYEQRMDNLFAWVKGYEDRLFPVAFLHPYEDQVEDKIRDAAARGACAFKFIPNTYRVSDEKPRQLFRLIESLDLPVFFHSGILYDFNDSSRNNRPLYWESLMDFQSLRFSMAHCGNPWVDECLALYGKFNWLAGEARAAANGEYSIYGNFPWVREHLAEKNGKIYARTPEMYLDTTPGARGSMRKNLLTQIHDRSADARRVFFGSDMCAESYSGETVRSWLQAEKQMLDDIGASEAFRENMYSRNILRFLKGDAE